MAAGDRGDPLVALYRAYAAAYRKPIAATPAGADSGAAEPAGATTPAPASDQLAARRDRRRGSRVAALAAAAPAGLVIAFVLGSGTAEDTRAARRRPALQRARRA